MDEENLRAEEIEILRPEIKDLETVFNSWRAQHELHFKLDPAYYKPNSPELDALAREYFQKTIATDSPHILIAKLQDEIVGFITFEEKSTGSTGIESFASNVSNHVEIIDLFIDERSRGRKVGTHLMTKVQEHCQRVSLPNMKVEVAALNTGAQRFYEQLGFTHHQVEMFKKI